MSPDDLQVPLGREPLEWLVPGASCGLPGADSLELGWCLALALCRPTVAVSFIFFMFLNFFLLLKITHLFGFLEQSFQSINRHKKWGLVVKLDQYNSKYIYLRK